MSAHDIARVSSECSASPAAAAAADSVSVSFAVAGARLDAGSFRRLALRFTPCFATSAASGVRVAALASAVPALAFAAGGFFLCEVSGQLSISGLHLFFFGCQRSAIIFLMC